MPPNSTSPYPGGNSGTSMVNATEIAAQAAQAAQMASRLRQQIGNHDSVKRFAAAMACLIILFTIFHWSRFLYSRYASRGMRKTWPLKAQVSVARYVKVPRGVNLTDHLN
jgi:hypothetical protein